MSETNEQLEDVAAAVVAALTGVATRREDVGGPHQVGDFSLSIDGCEQGLLEVSSNTQPERHSQVAALSRHLPRRICGSKRVWRITLRHELVKAKPLSARGTLGIL
jgi:hypothetical protein